MDKRVRWELEGELLEISLKCDKLRRKGDRSAEEEADFAAAEKRRALIEARLREGRLAED